MILLSPAPSLSTERLCLRAPCAGDWPHWREFHLSERARFIGGGPQIKPSDSWRAFGHIIGHWVMRGWGMFVFTLKGDDTPLGMTGPWFPEGWPEREIGWTIWSPAAEGKGYACEAALAARDHAYQALGWNGTVSYIHPDNARSIALVERLGAARDGNAPVPEFDEPCLVYRHPAPDRIRETAT
ncbi:GNAT family N-acetyltransferase [Paracoccus alkanivorans]|uniref:N-acetyltransferase n=1 Tax=Paracoccus alkanivorans TaxID=2116655 RepID=A0A3M0MJU2_9RHOB|nr:GNAT family N-acetyltransferase [Paracoccus alkanivorans]RMC37715.1 N-acetyltransferase [Paracoccus alkanivorans]